MTTTFANTSVPACVSASIRPSVHPSVRPSVRPSIHPSVDRSINRRICLCDAPLRLREASTAGCANPVVPEASSVKGRLPAYQLPGISRKPRAAPKHAPPLRRAEGLRFFVIWGGAWQLLLLGAVLATGLSTAVHGLSAVQLCMAYAAMHGLCSHAWHGMHLTRFLVFGR